MTNSDSERLAALREYLDEIPSGPWDTKIKIIKSIVGPTTLVEARVTPIDDVPGGTITQETHPTFSIHFKYASSDGVSQYDLFEDQDGDLTCSCPGFRYRGTCRHVKEFEQLRASQQIKRV